MRILQVSCFVDPAGRDPEALLEAWPTLGAVASATARAGADVTVIQAAGRDCELRRDGVRFLFIKEAQPTAWQRRLGPWSWDRQRKVAERIAAERPDAIHLHGLGFVRHAALIRTALPHVPLLLQDHADHVPQAWKRPWLRAPFRRLGGVAFTAVEQAEPFRAAGLIPPAMRVFEVPESSSTFTPGDRAEARAATGLEGDPCLLWLGRLDANKDPLAVLEALAIAIPSLPDVRLWCCYQSAPLLDAVRARIVGEPLRGRVHLLGEQPHARVEWLLRAADFLVQGSHEEGSGYAVIEALACGTPPLVTAIPSFRALTAGGRFGALSPVDDPKEMARAWIEWAGRDRTVLRNQARAHFERALSFDAIGRRLLAIYRELAA